VTGVVGRADVVACLFFLLALMAYIGSTTPRQRKGVGLAKVEISHVHMQLHEPTKADKELSSCLVVDFKVGANIYIYKKKNKKERKNVFNFESKSKLWMSTEQSAI